MSYAYNKAKKAKRKSKPKRGHQLGAGKHERRLSFSEKIRMAWGIKPK